MLIITAVSFSYFLYSDNYVKTSKVGFEQHYPIEEYDKI